MPLATVVSGSPVSGLLSSTAASAPTTYIVVSPLSTEPVVLSIALKKCRDSTFVVDAVP